MTEPRCENCRWWKPDDWDGEDGDFGICINGVSERCADWTAFNDTCQHHEKEEADNG